MQFVSQRAVRNDEGQLSDDDVHDLVLLDTVTGRRRQLVDGVFWGTPRWSPDGRRVRFEMRLPGIGFVWREVDVDTGTVHEVESDAPDGTALPGFYDLASVSPGGRWIVYRHETSMLCVARADGSDVFALKLPFFYLAAQAYWSPCGTRLAVDLAGCEDAGVYVIDLRTGAHRRVSPGRGDRAAGWPNHHVSGWSPDGTWVVVTKVWWHDPETCDYSLRELWLLPTDGTEAKQLTDDGRCHNAAIRPTGDAPAGTAEDELTFAWAQALRRADDRPAAGEAFAAQIRVDLQAARPRYTILLMVRTGDGMSYPTVADCESVPDGFAQLDAYLAANDYRPGDRFTVVFPRYATDDPSQDLTVLHIAHLILEETKTRMWAFDRDVPAPPD
ncbi:TolB family protein [Krasilnikovia sp. MM14-A1259]|uniref:TolB family protein n=1 Tax=Krasilnikovia sp. MM14-A1259 TaxID=3373539 RepID=UPI00399CE452